MKSNTHWTAPEYGFFGPFYQKGDKSLKGYLDSVPQTQEERTKEEVEGVIRLLGAKPGSAICDCPCGIGRHSIELSKRGFEVLAIDLSPEQLSVGAKLPHSELLTFQLGDMLDLASDRKFDAVINMFFSFGYFETDEENKKVAENFFKLLKRGGKFLMHTDVNMARVRNRKYKFNEKRRLVNGESLRIRELYNPTTKRINGLWEIRNEELKRVEVCGYSVRVYENEEFVNLCKEVGFKEVKIYSDWQGSPYSEDAEMVIFVAEK